MGARTVPEAGSAVRFARTVQLIGSCTAFTAKVYAAPDGMPGALPAVPHLQPI
jgi:hypothetical protein